MSAVSQPIDPLRQPLTADVHDSATVTTALTGGPGDKTVAVALPVIEKTAEKKRFVYDKYQPNCCRRFYIHHPAATKTIVVCTVVAILAIGGYLTWRFTH